MTSASTSGHITAMYCFSQTAPGANITLTLRANGGNTTVTCTVNNGQTKGSTTGLSVAFHAGDLLDVAMPGANSPNHPVSAAVTVAP